MAMAMTTAGEMRREKREGREGTEWKGRLYRIIRIKNMLAPKTM